MKKYFGWGIIVGLLAGFILATTTFAVASQQIKLIINGQEIQCDSPPQMLGGRVMVPAKYVAESLGASVEWDGQKRAVIITGKDSVETTEIRNQTSNNKEITQIDGYTIKYNNNIYYTLAEWANKHNLSKNDIEWDQQNNSVIIQKTKIVKVDGVNAINYQGITYLLNSISVNIGDISEEEYKKFKSMFTISKLEFDSDGIAVLAKAAYNGTINLNSFWSKWSAMENKEVYAKRLGSEIQAKNPKHDLSLTFYFKDIRLGYVLAYVDDYQLSSFIENLPGNPNDIKQYN